MGSVTLGSPPKGFLAVKDGLFRFARLPAAAAPRLQMRSVPRHPAHLHLRLLRSRPHPVACTAHVVRPGPIRSSQPTLLSTTKSSMSTTGELSVPGGEVLDATSPKPPFNPPGTRFRLVRPDPQRAERLCSSSPRSGPAACQTAVFVCMRCGGRRCARRRSGAGRVASGSCCCSCVGVGG